MRGGRRGSAFMAIRSWAFCNVPYRGRFMMYGTVAVTRYSISRYEVPIRNPNRTELLKPTRSFPDVSRYASFRLTVRQYTPYCYRYRQRGSQPSTAQYTYSTCRYVQHSVPTALMAQVLDWYMY